MKELFFQLGTKDLRTSFWLFFIRCLILMRLFKFALLVIEAPRVIYVIYVSNSFEGLSLLLSESPYNEDPLNIRKYNL